jgi:hypothetical protein
MIASFFEWLKLSVTCERWVFWLLSFGAAVGYTTIVVWASRFHHDQD